MKRSKTIFTPLILVIGLTGCAGLPSDEGQLQNGDQVDAVQESVLAVPNIPASPDLNFAAFKPDSSLSKLIEPLSQTALIRSSAVQEARAMRSAVDAARLARRPRILPTGSASLTEPDASTVGISIEQMLWDGGRVEYRITQQELRYTSAILEAWAEQNDLVRSGLEAYINLMEADARLLHYSELASDLGALSKTIDSRFEGGVADRSESLKLAITLQEVARERLSVETEKRIAFANLNRLLPEGAQSTNGSGNFDVLAAACNRNWPNSEPPADARARLMAEGHRIQESIISARRFPRLVLAAGAAIGAAATPGVGLQIDASDMLGPGAKASIEAASAETDAALVFYNTQRIDSNRELEQLDVEYTSFASEQDALSGLVTRNVETYELFLEQVGASTVQVTDGIDLLREAANTRIQLVQTQAAIALNCVRSASLRGYLQPIGEFHER
jgi:outer membrane protein TolC